MFEKESCNDLNFMLGLKTNIDKKREVTKALEEQQSDFMEDFKIKYGQLIKDEFCLKDLKVVTKFPNPINMRLKDDYIQVVIQVDKPNPVHKDIVINFFVNADTLEKLKRIFNAKEVILDHTENGTYQKYFVFKIK